MKRIRIRTITVAALGLLAWAGTAAAQAASPALLNVLEVRKLVARAEPGDHTALSAHFAALADRYDAEAARHAALSHTVGATSNRGVGITAELHHKWLADRNRESATTVRALAAHHERLAAGIASTVPADSARFEGGEGAPRPTDAELAVLAANAVTPIDHRELEEYFVGLAQAHTAEAEAHRMMEMSYRGTRMGTAGMHCERMIAQARNAARKAAEAAALHRQLATVGD